MGEVNLTSDVKNPRTIRIKFCMCICRFLNSAAFVAANTGGDSHSARLNCKACLYIAHVKIVSASNLRVLKNSMRIGVLFLGPGLILYLSNLEKREMTRVLRVFFLVFASSSCAVPEGLCVFILLSHPGVYLLITLLRTHAVSEPRMLSRFVLVLVKFY
jgi:hypothetical protein